jgi:hypothetical protein
MRVGRVYTFKHRRPIDAMGLAGVSGDLVVSDRRDAACYLDADGAPVWSKTLSFAPLSIRITADGAFVYLLTTGGQLLKVTREAELEWEKWVEREPGMMALRPDGNAVAVASHKGRFTVIDGAGRKVRLVHTTEPVSQIKFAGRSGKLFAASARGWVGVYDREFTPLGEFQLDERIVDLKVSANGRKIFLPALDAGLHVIETTTRQVASYDPGFPVARVGVDELGEKMAVVGLDGGMALLSYGGDILWRGDSPHSWNFCEMNPTGDRFVAISDKGIVEMYAVGDGAKPPPPKETFASVEVDERPTDDKQDKGHFDWLEI